MIVLGTESDGESDRVKVWDKETRGRKIGEDQTMCGLERLHPVCYH